MTDSGVSKKLVLAVVGIEGIVKLAEDAAIKWPYAFAVLAICIVFKLVQGFIDWNMKSKERTTNGNGKV